MAPPVVIKKYSNRRLYDTEESRYITMDELAAKIREGSDVRVVDVKTGEDLTQTTLTQIIVESRGAARMLPVPLLTQMIRMGDDALSEFLGQYMTGAMELYQHARRGAQAVAPYNPFAMLPFQATNALARLLSAPMQAWTGRSQPEPEPAPAPEPPPQPAPEQDATRDEVAMLRRKIAQLKEEVRAKPRRRAKKRRS